MKSLPFDQIYEDVGTSGLEDAVADTGDSANGNDSALSDPFGDVEGGFVEN